MWLTLNWSSAADTWRNYSRACACIDSIQHFRLFFSIYLTLNIQYWQFFVFFSGHWSSLTQQSSSVHPLLALSLTLQMLVLSRQKPVDQWMHRSLQCGRSRAGHLQKLSRWRAVIDLITYLQFIFLLVVIVFSFLFILWFNSGSSHEPQILVNSLRLVAFSLPWSVFVKSPPSNRCVTIQRVFIYIVYLCFLNFTFSLTSSLSFLLCHSSGIMWPNPLLTPPTGLSTPSFTTANQRPSRPNTSRCHTWKEIQPPPNCRLATSMSKYGAPQGPDWWRSDFSN